MDRQLESRAIRIRTAVAKLTPGAQRRYPDDLRAEVADYARLRLRRDRKSRFRVGKELGISDPTVKRLIGEATKTPLRRVRIVSPVAPPQSLQTVVVRAPGGLVVEGLDPNGIAALVRALS